MTTKDLSSYQYSNIKLLVIVVPILFAIHNAEEYIADLPAWSYGNTGMDIYKSSDVFLLAISILSFIVAMISVMFYLRKTRLWLKAFSLVITILGFNSVLHIISSIRYGAYTPGVITGLFLIFPLSVYYFYLLLKMNTLTKIQIGLIIFVGALTMIPFAYGALILSQYLLRI